MSERTARSVVLVLTKRFWCRVLAAASHFSASHVIETLIANIGRLMLQASNETADAQKRLSKFVSHVVDELRTSLQQVCFDAYAVHVLCVGIVTLTGRFKRDDSVRRRLFLRACSHSGVS